ncbi:hypothetical protein FGO68_gene11323 [Halteria grandinella]|uniref:Uncharacterized protein n=1 Tax=Halteria grandinella TaxID=5974 RepID=A0A8J8P4E2_HALGN|nr:hypothetical protein FGO68_gene11323 [Halteria grandinella]
MYDFRVEHLHSPNERGQVNASSSVVYENQFHANQPYRSPHVHHHHQKHMQGMMAGPPGPSNQTTSAQHHQNFLMSPQPHLQQHLFKRNSIQHQTNTTQSTHSSLQPVIGEPRGKRYSFQYPQIFVGSGVGGGPGGQSTGELGGSSQGAGGIVASDSANNNNNGINQASKIASYFDSSIFNPPYNAGTKGGLDERTGFASNSPNMENYRTSGVGNVAHALQSENKRRGLQVFENVRNPIAAGPFGGLSDQSEDSDEDQHSEGSSPILDLPKSTNKPQKKREPPRSQPFQQEIFDDNTPIGEFLASIKLKFLQQTLEGSTQFCEGRGVRTLGELENLTHEELTTIIPDPKVVEKLEKHLESEAQTRKRNEALVQNLLVDSNL